MTAHEVGLFAVTSALKPGAMLPSPVPLFGRYVGSHLLGMGGTSVVLEAYDQVLGRPVALKIWSPQLGSRYDWRTGIKAYSENEQTFFLQEARQLASLAHPAIAGIHDFGIGESGIPWMALEYVRGETLRSQLVRWADSGAFPPLGDVLGIFQQLADAVAFLHASALCQLDLKPENILIDGARVRLIDFASALERPSDSYKVERARHGTPGYIAPELITRQRAQDESLATPAADVFSLGIILLEMLALTNPLATPDLQRAAYEALGIVERQIYLDYRTAAFYPDFTRELACWADAYVQGLRALDPDKIIPALAASHPPLVHLVRECLSEDPDARPADGAAVLATISSIRASPSSLGPVFISHAHDDKEPFVREFVEALITRQVSVWYDSYDLRIGEPLWDRIFRAIEQARSVVVVLSRNMLTSSGVLEELRFAHLENMIRVKILPILIDDTPTAALPPALRSRLILRFPSPSSGDAFLTSVDNLVRQMRDLAGDGSSRHTSA